MKIVFLGAPGAGKGTVSEIVRKKFNIPIISTGDIIRKNLGTENETAKRLKDFIEHGELVPDEIVIDIVNQRISEKDCEDGFILDGFPRTISQAEVLEKMNIFIDKVINLSVSDDVIYKRMTGRRICKNCQSVYNINSSECMPKAVGVCDKCAGELISRDDDNLDVVKQRLKVYYEKTAPLIEFYKKAGKLVEVDAGAPLEVITSNVISIIEEAV